MVCLSRAMDGAPSADNAMENIAPCPSVTPHSHASPFRAARLHQQEHALTDINLVRSGARLSSKQRGFIGGFDGISIRHGVGPVKSTVRIDNSDGTRKDATETAYNKKPRNPAACRALREIVGSEYGGQGRARPIRPSGQPGRLPWEGTRSRDSEACRADHR